MLRRVLQETGLFVLVALIARQAAFGQGELTIVRRYLADAFVAGPQTLGSCQALARHLLFEVH